MRIIIEGADGSGKTTLAKRLSEHYGLSYVDMRGRDIMSFPFLYHTLDKIDVVWDRHFISERIYSDFYNLPFRITKGQEKTLVQKCDDHNIKIIVCIPDEHKLLDNEDEDIVKKHQELVDGYREFCDKFNITPIDPFKMTFEEVLKMIEED